MPSGAKKRKAAKKKQENQPQHSHGDEEDSKQQRQEDKGSGEGIEAKESQTEGMEKQKPTEKEENSIRVERGFNIEDESSTKNGSSKNDVGSSRSYSSASSNSSDSESHDDASKISGQRVVEKPIEEASDSISVTSPAIDSEKIQSSSEKDDVVSSEGDYSPNPRLIGSMIEEDGREKQTYVEDKAESYLSEIAIPIEKNEVMDPNERSAEETHKNLAVSDIATKPNNDIGVVSEPDSGITQPYIAEPPRPIQTTSWKGCCGIFELFTGSGR